MDGELSSLRRASRLAGAPRHETNGTSDPGCPVGDYLAAQVGQTLGKIEGVKAVRVEFVWDPPWRPEMMSAEAKRTLGKEVDVSHRRVHIGTGVQAIRRFQLMGWPALLAANGECFNRRRFPWMAALVLLSFLYW